jgi:hypothetical protein
MYSPTAPNYGNPAFQTQGIPPQPAPLNAQWTGQQPSYGANPHSQSPYADPYAQKSQYPQVSVQPQNGYTQAPVYPHIPTQVPPNFVQYHPHPSTGFAPSAAPAPGQVIQVQNFAGAAIGGAQGRHKIIVGLDFGTTYSGLAYADTTPGEPNISIIQNWPSCGNRAISQVPTEIAYTPESTTQFSWGYDIHPNLAVLKWFKLFLEYSDDEIKGMCELPPGKTILDVTADFMGAVYRHAIEQLYLQRGRAVMDITQVEFVLTIPAVWNEQAVMRTRQAAVCRHANHRIGFQGQNYASC